MAGGDGSGSGDGARKALLPVAGQTLIEYQARSAHAAGARHIVVMVDRVPAALVAAFDRLRADGLAIDVARGAREAADRVHPDEDVLVIDSGVVADLVATQEFARAEAPAILTLPDLPAFAHHERIDGSARWAGLALLKGEHLRHTATLIGDWSLGPTLLRVAIQRNAVRVPLDQAARAAIVADEAQAQAVSARLARVGGTEPGSPFAMLAQPLASFTAAAAMARSLPFDLILIVAPVLFGAAALLAWLEMPAAGFAVFLTGIVASAAAQRYGVAAMRPSPVLRWRHAIEIVALAVLILFMAGLAWRNGSGWGINALAAWAIANTVLAPATTRWAPGPGDQAAILLFASALDAPVIGLVLCIGWQVAAAAITRRLARL